ncbi:MAG TPA: hypothetical protein PK765_06000 [bacterium]|nr:hypothetical protein [bacterium]
MLDILVYRASKNEDHEYPEIRSLLERAIPEKIRKDTQRREQTEKEQGAYAETQLEEKQKHIQAMAKVSEGETGHYVWGLLSEYRTDPSIFNDRAKLAVKREIEKLLAWKLFDLSREQYPEEGQWLSAISPFCKTLEILRDDTKGFF